MKNQWIYKGKPLDDTKIPENAIGFLYMISDTSTSKSYIGKKLLTKAATKVVNGKKKKIRKPSDWQDYWSSSPTILEMIEKDGCDSLKREILLFCNTKSALNYAEEKAQFIFGVLESDHWINSNIRSKIFKKHFQNQQEFIKELNSTLSLLIGFPI
jgi:hypothetical protein